MTLRRICWFVIFAVLVASSALAESRKWTDATGKFSIDAELIGVKDGKVLLKKSNGSQVSVPLERLSEADQALAAQRTPQPAPLASTGTEKSSPSAAPAAPLPKCRIAVVGRGENAAKDVASLVETLLGSVAGVSLVERAEIDKVIREQELQAAFAPEGVGKRCELGRLLKADLLVWLYFQAAPVPHLSVVVSETRQGLRLCMRPIMLSNSTETDSKSILDLIDTARRLQGDKAVEIVAVPPLMNNSLTHEADQFQGVFARLIERDLLQRTGVVAVEFAEAQAVAREVAIAGQSKLERRLPLYVMGEYRLEGPPEKLQCRFSLKLLRGSTELDHCSREGLPLDRTVAELRQAAAELFDRSLGKGTPPLDAANEARQLTERGRDFMKVSNYPEAILLFESSLLLMPDQPLTHRDAMLACNQMMQYELSIGKYAFTLAYSDNFLKACAHRREAVRHMEMLFVGTKFTHPDILRKSDIDFLWSIPLTDPQSRELIKNNFGPDVLKQYDDPRVLETLQTLNEELVAASRRIFAAKAAAGLLDDTLSFMSGLAIRHSPWISYVRFKGESDPAALRERSRDRRDYCLKLLKQYAYSTDKRSLESLLSAPLAGSSSSEYAEFLREAAKIPGPLIKGMANAQVKQFNRRQLAMEQFKKRPPAAAMRFVAPKKPENVSDADADVVFQPIIFKEILPNGQEKTLTQERGGFVRCLHAVSKGTDVVAIEDAILLMRDKGRLERVPGLFLAPDPDMENRAAVCWDGKYLWAVCTLGSNPNNRNESILCLVAIDPATKKGFGIGPEEGLPPMKNYVLTAIEPGKVFLAGATDRSWLALVSIASGGRPKFDILHEARETAAKEKSDSRNPPKEGSRLNAAFKPTYCCAFTTPGTTGKLPEQRVLVGRFVHGDTQENSTFLVDPNKRTVEVLPRVLMPSRPEMFFEGQCYWGGGEGRSHKGLSEYKFASNLCRTGFPDFNVEVLDTMIPQGPMLMHEGRFYMFEYTTGELHISDGIAGKLKHLRGRCPGTPIMLFVSNHYGVVVRTSEGLYRVDLKSPQSPAAK
ncbi:MAG: SHD1 domain-containing protein [Planctomycetota bacterium]